MISRVRATESSSLHEERLKTMMNVGSADRITEVTSAHMNELLTIRNDSKTSLQDTTEGNTFGRIKCTNTAYILVIIIVIIKIIIISLSGK
jgi:hypothetical protein